MDFNQIYDFARSKGLSVEESVKIASANSGRSRSEIGDLVALAIAVPVVATVAGAVAVDNALLGIPSAVVGTGLAVGFGILGLFL